jgi:hypothetical protein
MQVAEVAVRPVRRRRDVVAPRPGDARVRDLDAGRRIDELDALQHAVFSP